MTHVLDSIRNRIEHMAEGNPESPLHVGEVMNLWMYLAMLEEANRYVEVGLNTTKDKELIEVMRKSYMDCEKQADEIKKLFKKEGIPLPDSAQQKPKSDPDEIPPGVKLTDEELANGISLKLVSAITLCATGLSQAIRTDIAGIWLRFITIRIEFASYFQPIMKNRGWLKIPPYYYSNAK